MSCSLTEWGGGMSANCCQNARYPQLEVQSANQLAAQKKATSQLDEQQSELQYMVENFTETISERLVDDAEVTRTVRFLVDYVADSALYEGYEHAAGYEYGGEEEGGYDMHELGGGGGQEGPSASRPTTGQSIDSNLMSALASAVSERHPGSSEAEGGAVDSRPGTGETVDSNLMSALASAVSERNPDGTGTE